MTVASEVTKHVFRANGITRDWWYRFQLSDTKFLQLYVTEPGKVPVQVISGFEVAAEQSKVVYPLEPEPPLASGCIVTLMRHLDYTQETDLQNQGQFNAETVERMSDVSTMQIQQLAEEVDRALKLPVDQQGGGDALAYFDEVKQDTADALAVTQKYRDQAQGFANDAAGELERLKTLGIIAIGGFRIDPKTGRLMFAYFGNLPGESMKVDPRTGHLMIETVSTKS